MEIDHGLNCMEHHQRYPCFCSPRHPAVLFCLENGDPGIQLFQDHPGVKFLGIAVDGFKQKQHSLAHVLLYLGSWETSFPDCYHLGFQGHKQMNGQLNLLGHPNKYIEWPSDMYYPVPNVLLRQAIPFGTGRLSTVSFHYVTLPLSDMLFFAAYTKACCLSFDHTTLQHGEYDSLNRVGQIPFAINVTKLSLKALDKSLATALVVGCLSSHEMFLDLEADLMCDSVWRQVSATFQNTRILQLNDAQLSCDLAFHELLYCHEQFNFLEDFRLSNVDISNTMFPTLLEFLRYSGGLRNFVIKGWKVPSLCRWSHDDLLDISRLFDSISNSNISRILFDEVPYEFLEAMEWDLHSLKVNDLYINALPPTNDSQYHQHELLKNALLVAIIEQVEKNSHLGIIEDNSQRHVAFLERNNGFLVEVDAVPIILGDDRVRVRKQCKLNYSNNEICRLLLEKGDDESSIGGLPRRMEVEFDLAFSEHVIHNNPEFCPDIFNIVTQDMLGDTNADYEEEEEDDNE